jgi:xanthine dehydrogenase accessory factor
MSSTFRNLRAFLDHRPVALVEVAAAHGSTPREAGAWMLVSAERILGTIGGGQLEFMAIDRAREMLGIADDSRKSESAQKVPPPLTAPGRATCLARPSDPHKGEGVVDAGASESPSPLWGGVRGGGSFGDVAGAIEILSIPLGPEIGQCCGGKVDVSVRLVDEAIRAELLGRAQAEDAARPHVFIFGGGHVGQALAAAFALLPLRVTVVETRVEALEDMPEGVETELTPLPDAIVRAAPPGSAFVVLTHDHALDFLIVAEALARDDAAYVGMIGSKTKKATFRSWYLKTAGGTESSFTRLVSPIGGSGVADKRPAVIAALAAAEIVTALAPAASRVRQPRVEQGAPL